MARADTMRVAWLGIAVLSMMACSPAGADADPVRQVVLLDVQGLWGGTDLWISEDGKAVCRFVRPPIEGESGLQEVRYSFVLSEGQKTTLSALIQERRFFHIKTHERPGVPDEARPILFVRSGEKSLAVGKWAGDRHADFDPIYEFLRAVAESGKGGTEIGKGPFERDWNPDSFPKNEAIRNMARPNPARG